MKYSGLLVLFLSLFLLASSCGWLTGPDDDEVDPRKFTWTVDTLAYPGSLQTAMRNIWGSSTKDVYVVGHNDQNWGLMWHFDGQQWTDVPLSIVQGGNIVGAIDLRAVYGFAADDVWAVGAHIAYNPQPPPYFLHTALLMHYDGQGWIDVGLEGPAVMDVWGHSPEDVFVVGMEGTIFHLDGQVWNKEQLPQPAQLISICGNGEDLFTAGVVQLTDYQEQDTSMIFRYLQGSWEVQDKQLEWDFAFSSRFGLSLFSPQSGTIYSATWGVFRWSGVSWEKVLPLEFAQSDIYGNASDNIITVGQFGSTYHWNGADWQELNIPREKLPEEVWLTGVWTDGREAFICGHDADGHQSYIIHGK